VTIQHVSDLTWDRLNAGDLAPALVEQARRHAAGCASCRARGAALLVTHERFVASPPPLRAASRRTWRAVLPALAIAAAAVAVLQLRAGQPHPGIDPRERIKGGFAVTAFAGRNGDAVPLGTGDPIFPGDRLQLSYSAPRAGYLVVLAIDGAGQVNVYFPGGATATWPAAAGYRRALPASIELDGVLGDERLWIALCEQPHAVAPLVDALARRGLAAEPPAGCEVQRLRFDKRPRPSGAR
jgi:hypothetical protein